MDVTVRPTVDHVLCAVHIPRVARRIACDTRRTRRLGQIVMVPVTGEPEFMDVTIRPTVDYVLGAVHIPRVAGRIACGARGARRLRQVVMVPAAGEAEPEFMDVTIRTP